MHRFLFTALLISSIFSPLSRAQIAAPALFRVRSANGVVSHLFGSFHYGIGLDELPSSTLAAFRQSTAHAYEMSVYREWDLLRRVGHEPNLMPELLRLAGKDPSLPGEFNRSEIAQLVELGIPRHVAARMRDDQCSLFMIRSMMFGASPARSLDAEFQTETVRLGRRFIELEDEQILEKARNDATTQGYDDECSIRKKLNDPQQRIEVDEQFRRMLTSYRSINPADVLAMGDDDDPDVWFRNKVWMGTLTPLMNSTPTFVVVGLAHLIGPHGLIQLLRAAGFTVEPE